MKKWLFAMALVGWLSQGALATNCSDPSNIGLSCILVDGVTLGVCSVGGGCERSTTAVPGGEDLSGTGTIALASDGSITGSGTIFTTELKVGDMVQCNGKPYWQPIAMIADDTHAFAIGGCGDDLNVCAACAAGSTFIIKRPIQTFLAADGTIGAIIDGLGRVSVGFPLTFVPFVVGGSDPANVSSGDGTNAGILAAFAPVNGGATSAVGATGGNAGSYMVFSGRGGNASGSGGTGGNGSSLKFWLGGGGDAQGSSGNGGNGGTFTIVGKDGGKSGASSSVGNGGKGASINITMGNGGDGGTSGDGGDFTVASGVKGVGSGGADGKIAFTSNDLRFNNAKWPVDASGVLNNDGAGVLSYVSVPRKLTPIVLSPQTADISDTTITSTAGTYSLSIYLVDTTADITAGAVSVHIKSNDGSAAQDVAVGPVVLTTLGSIAQATVVADLASGNLTYGATHTGIFGSAAYRLTVVPVRLN